MSENLCSVLASEIGSDDNEQPLKFMLKEVLSYVGWSGGKNPNHPAAAKTGEISAVPNSHEIEPVPLSGYPEGRLLSSFLPYRFISFVVD
jgi:hypothetical protein